ncbi:hypothetical protein EGR_09586 [Echinococcus granulosus]|uniref:Uncharacterized protein n=1 Tax=Echinococcus granulosus TaxID=6210 RepID=W6UQ95_ECHGR|nr:hypothetical protein EGR_09586 [Echinococcus granulosus]EUB55549.1 hypothetical protein EGR_09586 [Echinococcus granulosus]
MSAKACTEAPLPLLLPPPLWPLMMTRRGVSVRARMHACSHHHRHYLVPAIPPPLTSKALWSRPTLMHTHTKRRAAMIREDVKRGSKMSCRSRAFSCKKAMSGRVGQRESVRRGPKWAAITASTTAIIKAPGRNRIWLAVVVAVEKFMDAQMHHAHRLCSLLAPFGFVASCAQQERARDPTPPPPLLKWYFARHRAPTHSEETSNGPQTQTPTFVAAAAAALPTATTTSGAPVTTRNDCRTIPRHTIPSYIVRQKCWSVIGGMGERNQRKLMR